MGYYEHQVFLGVIQVLSFHENTSLLTYSKRYYPFISSLGRKGSSFVHVVSSIIPPTWQLSLISIRVQMKCQKKSNKEK